MVSWPFWVKMRQKRTRETRWQGKAGAAPDGQFRGWRNGLVTKECRWLLEAGMSYPPEGDISFALTQTHPF